MTTLTRPFHRLFARCFGYFWLPCPLCRKPFGGHQWHTSSKRPGEIRDPEGGPYAYQAICPRCRKAGMGEQ